MDTTVADPLIGRVLDGRYTVESRIARGGMATVYVGLDGRLGRRVALKVMHPSLADDEAFVARFYREAHAAAGLSSPYVVEVFDQGIDDGPHGRIVFLVLELIRGRTLRHLLEERGRLTPDEATSIVDPVLGALAAAHAAGLVHRDVKPENVLLADDGRVKVADFGLARAVEGGPKTSATGVLIGTVGYLAPEQVLTGRADARSDVYATGVLLFELLTGRPPFEGDTPLAVAYRHVHEQVPAPGSLVPGIPPAMDDLVLRATAQDPDRRPADGAAMLHLLREAHAHPDVAGFRATQALQVPADLSGPQPTGPQPNETAGGGGRRRVVPPASAARDRLPRWAKRRRTGLIALLVVAVVTALTGLAAWSLGNGDRVHVPGLTGATPAFAKATLRKAGLKVVVDKGVYSDDVKPTDVVSTSPEAGRSVPKGSRVHLVPSLGPDAVKVPLLVGRTPGQAGQLLAAAGLQAGTTTSVPNSLAKGQIVRTAPAIGTTVKHGTVVDFVTSSGQPPVQIPDDLVGMSVTDATAELQGLGLSVKRVDDPNGDPADIDQVTRTSPDPGQRVNAGETVTLFSVADDTQGGGGKQGKIRLPDVVGEKASIAERQLEARGLNVTVIELPFTDSTVRRMDPGGGSRVERGSGVTLYAF